jgi:nucleoside-triphosphatase
MNGDDIVDTCFLLTGKARIGKTTAIKNIINQMGPENFGGFYTEEIRDTIDRVGFNCVTLSGESAHIANVNSNSAIRIGRYGVEIDVFENIALRAIRESLNTKKITVIDEIGFMQMLSEPFHQMINEIVSSTTKVILGTVARDSHPKIDPIKQLSGVKLYELNEDNRDLITGVIAEDIHKANQYILANYN